MPGTCTTLRGLTQAVAAKKGLVASLALLFGFPSADALACMCSPGEAERPLEKAEVVFVGRPIKIEVIPVGSPPSAWQRFMDSFPAIFGTPSKKSLPEHPDFLGSVRVTFDVSAYTKGSGGKQFQVMTGYGDSDCGLPVSISKRYTIYARRINGALRSSYCFGSAEYVRRRSPPSCSGS